MILKFALVAEYFNNSSFQPIIDGVLMLLLQFNSTFQSGSLVVEIHSIDIVSKETTRTCFFWFILYSFILHWLTSVRGPFSAAQPCVVHWRDDLTRPRFFLGSCIQNSTLGHVVQWLPAYF